MHVCMPLSVCFLCPFVCLLVYVSNNTAKRFVHVAGASIPMGQGGHVPPNIYEGGTSMVMSPQYFRSDVV